ncbi:MAG: alpha/beta fold hydrolase [Chloroflexi bacterium]|nr:alpha/beta fold hydrolase [Chloroflexota bacterium]
MADSRKSMKTIRYWLNLFSAAVLFVIVGILAVTLIFTNRWTQSVLHPPSRTPPTGDLFKTEGIEFESVTLTTEDGLDLAAWYTSPQNGAVILIAHGYNDNRPESIYAMFVENGYGALAWDFRAHGGSDGGMSTLGYYERMDVEAALDFALAQEGAEHVGAWGGSMGAATLILSAAEHPEIEALVADSAYPSLEDVLRLNMPVKLFQPFVLFWGEYYSGAGIDDVNPVGIIGKISPRPVFVIDGWEGGAMAMNSPYRLYDAANEPKEIWVKDGIPHMGMFANDPAQYQSKVVHFFEAWLLNKK